MGNYTGTGGSVNWQTWPSYTSILVGSGWCVRHRT